jgi:hypothetical protein
MVFLVLPYSLFCKIRTIAKKGRQAHGGALPSLTKSFHLKVLLMLEG